MYKFIFNILKKLFILLSSVIALCSLALIALCIIILASKSITITDNNKYISKLMSWYFDKEVYFEEVKINNISLKEYYTFKIKNLTINKINDYQNLEVEYAKFDINISNILNRVSKFNSIYLNNISIDYLRKDEKSVFAFLSARVGSISENKLGGWYSYRASKTALNQIIKNFSIEIKRTNKNAIFVGLQPGTVKSFLSKPFERNVKEDNLFTPEYSAEKLLQVINDLSTDDSGKFFAWNGEEIQP